MISIKGFAIVSKKLSIKGESYYGNHTQVPFSEIYNSKPEAEKALRENKKCYISPQDLEVLEVEAIIK